MLECFKTYTPKPTNIVEFKAALLTIIWDLPQEFIDKQWYHFTSLIVAAGDGHYKHCLNTE